MRTRKLTTRLSIVALAVASAAFAPRGAMAQDPALEPRAAPVAPVPPVPPAPPDAPVRRAPSTTPAAVRFDQAAMRAVEAQIRAAEGELRAQESALRALPNKFHFRATMMADTPVVLVTRDLSESALAEMKEDLTVMDKLVRDEIARAGGEDPDRPWGIKLTMVGRFPPMYVEGGGAVFSTAVNFPLAAAGGGATTRPDGKPPEPDSKWIKVKRELTSQHLGWKIASGPPQIPAFDQEKLDALKSALTKALPEAKNFRHLQENESVFVTIVGVDDAGAPLRMTLKASKADIDAASAGKMAPEEFAQRVAVRIG